MTAPAIKPGTRCECRGTESHSHTVASPEAYATGNHSQCPAEAVRMVKVELHEWDEPVFINVPMCASCAAYHEARQKAGA